MEATALPPGLLPSGDEPAFIGREHELAQLLDVWRAVANGATGAALVGGEPGIGKTRLAAELAARVKDEAFVVYGRCDQYVGLPYQPFIEALEPLVARLPDVELARAAELGRVLPSVRARLGDAGTAAVAEPDAERYLLFESVTSLVESVARVRPILLVVDDLQWATEGSLLLLRHLVRSSRGMRLLALGTYRREDRSRAGPLANLLADLRNDRAVARIVLPGLEREEVRAFVSAVAGHALDERGSALAAALHTQTAGNPFFLNEVLRHLADTGAVYWEGNEWVSDRTSIAELGLPEGVRDVVERRVASVSADTAKVLTVAAVIGQSFAIDVIEQVFADDEPAGAALDLIEQAMAAGLVAERADGTFEFVHALVAQTLVEDLARPRLASIHQRIAEAMESLAPAYGSVALAHHFVEGARPGRTARAAAYSLAAGRESLMRLAHEEAIELFGRGINALDLGPDIDHFRRAELLLGLAEAHDALGNLEQFRAYALEAAAEARLVSSGALLATAAAHVGRWVEVGRPDPELLKLCDEAFALLDDTSKGDAAARLWLELTVVNHDVYAGGGGDAAASMAAHALELARELGDPESLGIALSQRCASLLDPSDIDERIAVADELVAHGQKTRDGRSLLDGHWLRGAARLELGDRVGFEEDAGALVALGRDRHWWIASRLGNGFRIVIAMAEGRYDDADHEIDVSLRDRPRPNDLLGYAAQLFNLRREQGRSAELVDLVSVAVQSSPDLTAMRAALAVAYLEAGDADRARAIVPALVDRIPHDQTRMAMLVLLAELATGLADVRLARPILDELQAYAGRLAVAVNGFLCFGAVDRFIGMLQGTLGDRTSAVASCAAALELEERVAAPAWARRTQGWLEGYRSS